MRPLSLAASLLCLLAAIVPADAPRAAGPGPYLALSVVYLRVADTDARMSSVTFETGRAVQGAAGYRFSEWFRGEVELGYGRAGLDRLEGPGFSFDLEGRAEVFAAAVNGFLDLPVSEAVQPYLGGGIGIAHSRVEDAALVTPRGPVELGDDRSTDLLLQGEAGLVVAVTEHLAVVPSYRYLLIDNGGNGIDDTSAHLFRAGLRYSF